MSMARFKLKPSGRVVKVPPPTPIRKSWIEEFWFTDISLFVPSGFPLQQDNTYTEAYPLVTEGMFSLKNDAQEAKF